MRWTPERAVALLFGIGVLLAFLPARRSAGEPSKPGAARIGLVFDVGGRGDKSFNDAAFAGLARAQKELGVAVEYLEPAGSEDREAGLRLFAARGFDLVIGVGHVFSSDVTAVARDYPGVSFAGVDYEPPRTGPPPNVAGLAFREEQGSFLVGAVAGLLTKSKHVGFVGGMQIPPIRKFEAGYVAGVKAVCDACKLHGAYAGFTPDAFRDPAKGKTLAIAQIAEGADVIYHASGGTGHGVFEAANGAGVMAIGVDKDQYDEMPNTIVTSMIKRVDLAVFETIRAASEKRFKGGMTVFGLEDEAVDYVKEGPHAARIPDDVKARVAELKKDIVSGKIVVPTE
jgi:basic membrane protein A